MNRKVIGATFVGLLLFKAASRHHGMGPERGPWGRLGTESGPWGRHGMGSRHGHRGRGLDPNDPRRQWIREFHRGLHEADEAEAAAAVSAASTGSTGDAAPGTSPATAG